jgi:hypothetical protein
MAKATEGDRIADLEREVADLRRRVELLELFLDSEHRERMGTTLDDVRAAWRKSRQAGEQSHLPRRTAQ